MVCGLVASCTLLFCLLLLIFWDWYWILLAHLIAWCETITVQVVLEVGFLVGLAVEETPGGQPLGCLGILLISGLYVQDLRRQVLHECRSIWLVFTPHGKEVWELLSLVMGKFEMFEVAFLMIKWLERSQICHTIICGCSLLVAEKSKLCRYLYLHMQLHLIYLYCISLEWTLCTCLFGTNICWYLNNKSCVVNNYWQGEMWVLFSAALHQRLLFWLAVEIKYFLLWCRMTSTYLQNVVLLAVTVRNF